MKDLDYYLNLNYEIKIRKLTEEDGGGWFAELPLLPGCMSDGETPQEAIDNLTDAKKCWIETSMELGRHVPEPVNNDFSGQLRVRMPKSLHRTLSEMAKNENVSLNQFINYHLARSVGYARADKERNGSCFTK
jgi:antitoxin HicB